MAALIAFALQLQLFFDPVRDLVLQYTQLQRAMAGGERVIEVLDTKPEFEDAPDAIDIDNIEGRVDFNHMTFRYVDDVPVLDRHRPSRRARRVNRLRRPDWRRQDDDDGAAARASMT